MGASGSDILIIIRAIAEELVNRFRARLEEQPRLTTALGMLVTAIGLVIVARIFFWLFFSSPAIALGTVTGQVTLNGSPLAAATVEFTPASGSPSYGITDSSGRYSLSYLPGKYGATLGKHTVRITTYNWITHSNGSKQEIPERVPERYNTASTLTATVEAGAQQFDWTLKSP
jgi:uncharacterized transporter YbjL